MPDGPFIALPVLTDAFPQGLDTVPDDTLDKLRLAWAEVQEAPDLLTPAWEELVLTDLLGYTPATLAEGGALPDDLRSRPSAGGRLQPDAIAYGPDGQGGRAERLLIYRLPAATPLTTASRAQPSAAEQAADLCRHRGTPLALLTNGALWALVHARPAEPATTAVFDADLWLEERDLLRAFASLLACPPGAATAANADGSHSMSLAGLFARSAEAQAEVTTTLGVQVRQAVELLVGELSRLDRESGGRCSADVQPREVYRGALTVMMRLVFLLYAEEQRLLPVSSELYATAYSVDRAARPSSTPNRTCTAKKWVTAGPPPGLGCWPPSPPSTSGCEYDEMRIPPYGGSLFDPDRYPWLDRLAVTDRVVHEMLGALLILKRRAQRCRAAVLQRPGRRADRARVRRPAGVLLPAGRGALSGPHRQARTRAAPGPDRGRGRAGQLLRLAGQGVRRHFDGGSQGYGRSPRGPGRPPRGLRQRR